MQSYPHTRGLSFWIGLGLVFTTTSPQMVVQKLSSVGLCYLTVDLGPGLPNPRSQIVRLLDSADLRLIGEAATR